jgi:membrane-associated phospholipid phosphatase
MWFARMAVRRNVWESLAVGRLRLYSMPVLVLILVALAFGVLVTLASYRFVPPQGATAAAAVTVAQAADRTGRRRAWRRARMDASLLTGLALTAAVAAVIAGGLVIALLAYLVRGNPTLHTLDTSAARWGNEHATHLTTRVLYLITDLGDWPVVPAIAIAIGLLELRRAPNRYLVPFLLVVILGDQLITNVIKGAIDRARPTLNPIAATLGPSFPSGHSSTAASFYAALALILARKRGPRARALFTGLAATIAVAVASSRVLLDVHWLSDVIAGVSLGWAWFALCAIAFGGRLLRFAAPLQPDTAAAAEAEALRLQAPHRPSEV